VRTIYGLEHEASGEQQKQYAAILHGLAALFS
jgi:hypothetical protein